MIKARKEAWIFSVAVFVIAAFLVSGTVFAGGMADKPIDLEKVSDKDKDKELLRLGIIAELDAVSFYEQIAATTKNEEVRKIMLHTAKEEKTHVGEFQALLLKLDKEQKEELEAGRKELEEALEE